MMSFLTCFLGDGWALFLSKYYIRVQLKYFLYYYWGFLFVFYFIGWRVLVVLGFVMRGFGRFYVSVIVCIIVYFE